ncbi:MAG: DUF2796 domain-containing protein [Alphaproteobacteria bacterium]
MMTLARKQLLSRTILGALAGAALTAATPVAAQDDHARSAGSHVHGEADLAAALDGTTLVIELRSALWNLIGFEHAPQTDAQREAAESAEATLTADPAMLFGLPAAARCTLEDADVSMGAADHRDGDHGKHASDEDHEHKDHEHEDHNHEDHDSHDHGSETHDKADHGDSTDADAVDMLATYQFACARPLALDRMALTLFDHFERLEIVKASFLSAKVQAAATLKPNSPVFTVK